MCGKVHPLTIHTSPRRSWFDANGERVWIRVIVIKCAHARAAGKQYTKRLLPDFLIPYSPIRLDRVLEAERSRREEGARLEDCSYILGCLELRTVRKHLKRLHTAAASVALQLSEYLAHIPQYARLPEPQPGQCTVLRLNSLYHRTTEAAGAAGRPVTSLRQSLQEQWWKLVGKPPTSCVSRVARPP
ncbi:MAG: hypothetical protein U5P10_11225 [Spirochaetia bacterium]|nr:hypothetical protein [Spirochaetia bacterium]